MRRGCFACLTGRHWGREHEFIYHKVPGRSKEALAWVKGAAGEKSQEMESRRDHEEKNKL